jgi:phosphate-selective porin OprO and OprP
MGELFMSRQDAGRIKLRPIVAAVVLTIVGMSPMGWAQVPGADVQPGGALAPRTPSATVPPPTAPSGTTREAELEERVRQLEAKLNAVMDQVGGLSAAGAGGAGYAPPAARNPEPSGMGGPLAPGQSMPPNPPPSNRFETPAMLANKPLTGRFGPGFEFKTEDDEYVLQFHNLTQFDFRGYQQGGQSTVHDTFAFPRQWFIASGQLTRQYQYFVSLQNGFDTVSLLDAWLDWNYDPRFKIRGGRFKTPFTYEFYVEPIQGLFVPERSLFFNNFALNRSEGVMGFGRLFNSRLDYAIGGFNGVRNGFLDANDGKAVAGLLNFKPFGDEQNTLLENFNVGGSVYAANQTNTVPSPVIFRNLVPTSGNTLLGTPFLTLNSNVRDSGERVFWDMHMAWFYQQFSLIGEWGSGFENFAKTTNLSDKTRLPVQAYYVESAYFLTGETNSGTGVVKPFRDFKLAHGQFGPGAWQVFTRYNYLNMGREIFTNGLADPANWTNSVQQVDLGLNWSLSQYIKIIFDWNHCEFGSPVLFAPNRRQLTADTFMLRFQIFF